MKITGIVLIVLQFISLIPALIAGDNFFANGLANVIGRFSFGIVGLILLIIANKKNKED